MQGNICQVQPRQAPGPHILVPTTPCRYAWENIQLHEETAVKANTRVINIHMVPLFHRFNQNGYGPRQNFRFFPYAMYLLF
jgi:hypothetical protein